MLIHMIQIWRISREWDSSIYLDLGFFDENIANSGTTETRVTLTPHNTNGFSFQHVKIHGVKSSLSWNMQEILIQITFSNIKLTLNNRRIHQRSILPILILAYFCTMSLNNYVNTSSTFASCLGIILFTTCWTCIVCAS